MIKFEDLEVGDVLEYESIVDTMYELVLAKNGEMYTYYSFKFNEIGSFHFKRASNFLTKIQICEMWKGENNAKI